MHRNSLIMNGMNRRKEGTDIPPDIIDEEERVIKSPCRKVYPDAVSREIGSPAVRNYLAAADLQRVRQAALIKILI